MSVELNDVFALFSLPCVKKQLPVLVRDAEEVGAVAWDDLVDLACTMPHGKIVISAGEIRFVRGAFMPHRVPAPCPAF